jgi:hypothetical protein
LPTTVFCLSCVYNLAIYFDVCKKVDVLILSVEVIHIY